MNWVSIRSSISGLFVKDPSKNVVIKNLGEGGDITIVSGEPGMIVQHRPDPDFYRRQAMQQQALANQHYQQLQGQLQMGAATGAAAAALRPGAFYPGLPNPEPKPEEPVTETKTEVYAAQEPELEEIVKDDGSTIVRLKK